MFATMSEGPGECKNKGRGSSRKLEASRRTHFVFRRACGSASSGWKLRRLRLQCKRASYQSKMLL